MEQNELMKAIEAILFAAGERVEISRLAMQKLLSQVSRNDEIIDKWLDYSMIEGGIILATATAEILTELSEFSPQTPD